MKIGIAAAKSPGWPKIDWVQTAAENLGHDVRRSTEANGLSGLLRSCDVVIAGHRNLAGRWPNVSKSWGRGKCPLVYWWFDLIATEPGLPLQQQPLFATYRRHLESAGVAIVKERGLLDEYRALGINAQWCDQGCPSNYPRVACCGKRWDVLLWGQVGHYGERARGASALVKAGFRVAWASSQPTPAGVEKLPWTRPEELPALASQAACVLSCGRRNDLEGYLSDGFWLAMGMGACVIRRSIPGLEAPCLLYHNEEELISAATWVKKNPDEAGRMGRESREWVMSNHTLEHRVQQVLNLAGIKA